MASSRNTTRQRLIQTALELFAIQGVTETTTKLIAEQANVNEVTLFRQFGSKYGLLFAVIEEGALFTRLGQALVQQMPQTDDLETALRAYAVAYLRAVRQLPEMVRSVIGEAGQYPPENRMALGRGLTQANQTVADYFKRVIERSQKAPPVSPEALTSLLNCLLLGYVIVEFTSDAHQFWSDQDDFLNTLVTLCLTSSQTQTQTHGDRPSQSSSSALVHVKKTPEQGIEDLSASLVHEIMQRAKKQGSQEYAIAYVLFGAGLSPATMARLERSHHISDRSQHLLQITQDPMRQVPVNQWIMGKRYGTYLKNPLTQWLKTRKDTANTLFLDGTGSQPITERDIRQLWNTLTYDLITLSGRSPTLEQAQQTWCIEMLMRGMTPDAMALLTGMKPHELEPYVQRAREKAVLEQAIRLDQKNG